MSKTAPITTAAATGKLCVPFWLDDKFLLPIYKSLEIISIGSHADITILQSAFVFITLVVLTGCEKFTESMADAFFF